MGFIINPYPSLNVFSFLSYNERRKVSQTNLGGGPGGTGRKGGGKGGSSGVKASHLEGSPPPAVEHGGLPVATWTVRVAGGAGSVPVLGRGASAVVLRGEIAETGQGAAVKVFCFCRDSVAAAQAEGAMYQVGCLGCWLMAGSGLPSLLTPFPLLIS